MNNRNKTKIKTVAIQEDINKKLDDYIRSQYPEPKKIQVVGKAIEEYINREITKQASQEKLEREEGK